MSQLFGLKSCKLCVAFSAGSVLSWHLVVAGRLAFCVHLEFVSSIISSQLPASCAALCIVFGLLPDTVFYACLMELKRC